MQELLQSFYRKVFASKILTQERDSDGSVPLGHTLSTLKMLTAYQVFDTDLWEPYYLGLLLDAISEKSLEAYNAAHSHMILQILLSIKSNSPHLYGKI